MDFHDRKREEFVILSAAKDLRLAPHEILRCAQDDSPEVGRHYSSSLFIRTEDTLPPFWFVSHYRIPDASLSRHSSVANATWPRHSVACSVMERSKMAISAS